MASIFEAYLSITIICKAKAIEQSNARISPLPSPNEDEPPMQIIYSPPTPRKTPSHVVTGCFFLYIIKEIFSYYFQKYVINIILIDIIENINTFLLIFVLARLLTWRLIQYAKLKCHNKATHLLIFVFKLILTRSLTRHCQVE